MPRITLAGIGRSVDGEYDLDLSDQFTGHELHLIKQISGVRVGEIGDAMVAGDYDLIIALTKIAIQRSGKTVDVDVLLQAKVGAITFEPSEQEQADAEEEDALPPASAPSGANETGSASGSSGLNSKSDSAHPPESDPSRTGDLTLVTGSTSGQAISAT